MFLSKSSAAVASPIQILEKKEKKALIKGASVFKKDKLVGKLNRKETRGLLWIKGQVKSGIVVVRDPAGKKVSLEIMKSSSKIKSKLDNGKLIIKVQILEEANLGENLGKTNLVTTKMISFLEKQQNKVIKEEIESALKKAYQYKADIFGFGNQIYREYPEEWEELEANWGQIFSDITVEIDVKTRIREVGMNIKPPVPGKM